jgi:anthranilate synthase component I
MLAPTLTTPLAAAVAAATAAVPTLLPVVRELPADLETPVSLYLRLAGHGPSFLLESVTGGEQVARYSFIGVNPTEAYVLRGDRLAHHTSERVSVTSLAGGCDPLDVLRDELARCQPLPVPGLPRFAGGLVGYLAYETAAHFEPTLTFAASADEAYPLPDAIFLLADTVIAFDHAYGRMLLIVNVPLDGGIEAARLVGEARLDDLQRRLAGPLPAVAPSAGQPTPDAAATATELRSNMTPDEYMDAVLAAKEHIAAGDIFQVVLSQRFSRRTTAAPFSIYRALRRLNPSPYMFFFDFGDLAGDPPAYLIGASPEMHVRLEAPATTRHAILRPIAGTRPRGQDEAADAALATELLADPKECAEHVMLVDLARNDLGRVCDYGSVHVAELMGVERYSHVMHIVSQVEGRLRPARDAFDLLRATFPAGTVSGAPKIRAMQIISELERGPRGPYAGAVGYLGYDGSLDTCITIRTLVVRGDTVSVQAGAGIVADSDPASEYRESVNKARALAVAVARAEEEQGGVA